MPWAILLLLLVSQEERIDDLILHLGDESVAARDKSENALFQVGNLALPALQIARDHADAEIRIRARRVSQRIQWAPWVDPIVFARYPELKQVFDEGDSKKFVETCSHHAGWRFVFPGLEAYLIRLLEEPDPALRKLAISCLSIEMEQFNRRRPIKEFVDRIMRWDPTADEDPEGWCLQILSKTAFKLCGPVDLRILSGRTASQPQANLVLQVMRASLGDDKEVPALVEILRGKTAWLRALALEAIARGHLVGARDEVFRCLNVLELRWQAFRTLETLVDKSCREEVLSHLRNRPSGRAGDFDYGLLVRAEVREAAPFLIEELGHQYGRENAAKALADLGIREAFGPICDLISDDRDGDRFATEAARLASAETVSRLLEMLEKYPVRNHYSTFAGLRSLQDPDAQRIVVRRFVEEKSPKIRRWLFDGLGSSSFLDDAVLENIASDITDPLSLDAAFILYGRRGTRALPLLEKALLAAANPDRWIVRIFEDYPSEGLIAKMGELAALDILERWATPSAKKELTRLAKEAKHPALRHAAAASLAWTGGDVGDLLVTALVEWDPEWGYLPRLGDLLEIDYPGLRDALRNQVKARGVEPYLTLLEMWAHPDMIPALKSKLSTPHKVRRELSQEDGFSMMCLASHFPDFTGYMALKGLAVTGDRTLASIFQERLSDPSPYNRSVAIETLGRWRVREAVPTLRQLVESGSWGVRGEAIAALAEITAPGTGEFLRVHLRDNYWPAAYGLAKLGVDAHKEVLELMSEQTDPVGAYEIVDRLANPKVYANVFKPLPRGASRRVQEFPTIVENMTGSPCRLSKSAREAVEARDLVRCDFSVRTLCDAFQRMASYDQGLRLLHLYRNGAIEICTVEEARQYWSQR